MKHLHYYLAVFIFAFLAFQACNEEDSPSGGKESNATIICVTGDSDEITINSATLKGIAYISDALDSKGSACFFVSTVGSDASAIEASGTRIDAGDIPAQGGEFSAVASNLEPSTLYYYFAKATIDNKESVGSIESFMTLSRPKELIVTAEATNITKTGARLYGYVDLEQAGGDAIFGILLSDDDAPSILNGMTSRAIEIDRNNKFFSTISGLASGATYYYRAYVKIGDIFHVGEVKSFTTEAIDASATTLSAGSISYFTGTLNGRLVSENSDDMYKTVGFIYGMSSTLDGLKSNGTYISSTLGSDGYFSKDIDGLKSSTKYYYAARATVGDGTFWGEVMDFTTKEIKAKVTTNVAANIDMASCTISGNLSIDGDGVSSKSVWFLYSTTATSLDALKASGTKVTSTLNGDGSFNKSLSGLNVASKYYYVACATVGDKDFYGDVLTFTTKDINATVKTLSASDVALFTATLNGSIKVDDSANLSKSVWFLFGESLSSLDALKASGKKVSTASISYEGSFIYVLTSLPSSTKFYYVACADVSGKVFYGEVLSFSTKKETDYGEAVDLGLSVKWRSCNIGATTPEDYGNYFAWGEIEPKETYYWDNYKWCNGSESTLTKYNNNKSYGVVDNRLILEKDDDVASVLLGDNWRMPTYEEWEELINNCTWTQDTQNGVKGRKITSNKNGKSIFLPAAGRKEYSYIFDYVTYGNYWTSSLYQSNPSEAWRLVYNPNPNLKKDLARFEGFSIRPVTK